MKLDEKKTNKSVESKTVNKKAIKLDMSATSKKKSNPAVKILVYTLCILLAVLAAVGCGEYPDVVTACDKLVKVVDVVEPEIELVEKYNKRYEKFKKLYPTVKALYEE